MNDFRIQIRYLNKRFDVLVEMCKKDVAEMNADHFGEIRCVVAEIINKERKILDQLMVDYYRRKLVVGTPNKKQQKNVSFPIAFKKEDIRSNLGKFGAKDLDQLDPVAYSIIEAAQPYHAGNEWLGHLQTYYNLDHNDLLPQQKKRDDFVVVGNVFKVRVDGAINMKNCSMDGKKIDVLTMEDRKITGRFDPTLPIESVSEISYLIKDTSINAIELCKNGLDGVEKLVSKFGY